MDTTINPDDFRGHETEVRGAANRVSAYSQPDTAHVSAVLDSYGPVIGPYLAQGLATHYSDRKVQGQTLSGRYDASGDALVQGRHRFISAEDRNATDLTT